jgi:hypothetical protein
MKSWVLPVLSQIKVAPNRTTVAKNYSRHVLCGVDESHGLDGPARVAAPDVSVRMILLSFDENGRAGDDQPTCR